MVNPRKSFYRLFFFLLASVALLVPVESVYASTECTGKIVRIWNGDDNNNWLFYDNGLAAIISSNDPDSKNILAAATASLIADKTTTIRFVADNIPCNVSGNTTGANGVRSDVVGMFLNK